MKTLRPVYFIAATTALLLVVVEVGAHFSMKAYDQWVAPLLRPELSEAAKLNYAHLAPPDLAELRQAFDAQRFRYEPVVGFIEGKTASRFLNVDEYGIRQNGPSRRQVTALENAVWFFGGSTTFGEGIADRETIPSQLEAVTGHPVVNLGVRNYSSTEENLLLNHYLRIGYRPRVAIFLDGINETCEPNLYHEEMDILVGLAQEGNTLEVGRAVVHAFGRVNRKVRRWLGYTAADPDAASLECERDGKINALRTIHARRLGERAALCRLYDIACRTVVQPFAAIHGPKDGFDPAFRGARALELEALFEHLEPNWRDAGATFITDALDGYDRHPFIDEVHYSADASRLIAETLAHRLNLQVVGSATAVPPAHRAQ